MYTQILEWFRKPFPLVDSLRDILLISLGSGVIVIAFLTVFKPFGINTINKDIFLYLSGYGIIDTVVTAFNLIIWPRILPTIFNRNTWTTGKNLIAILVILLSISLSNYIYGEYLAAPIYVEGLKELDREGILSWLFVTFSVGVIPVIFALYFIEKKLVVNNQYLAEEFNQTIRDQDTDSGVQEIVIETGRDTVLRIISSDFICVQAKGGNYATVYWLDGSVTKREMIRLTLLGFLEKTEFMESIVRCHKSYIMNLDKVQSFQGNARSVTVSLDGLDFEIPVSRSFPREKLLKHS